MLGFGVPGRPVNPLPFFLFTLFFLELTFKRLEGSVGGAYRYIDHEPKKNVRRSTPPPL